MDEQITVLLNILKENEIKQTERLEVINHQSTRTADALVEVKEYLKALKDLQLGQLEILKQLVKYLGMLIVIIGFIVGGLEFAKILI